MNDICGGNEVEKVDGSDLKELVENEELFGRFVDHKFHELDKDGDGKLSVNELQPAVADIGAALGLPPKGSSSDSDHIYSEVLNEFTHGKQRKVSRAKFKEVLSDFLLGVAAGLKRDPIAIIHIDGKDLSEFINGPCYEPEMASIFSRIQSPDRGLRYHIIESMKNLTVTDCGMPPCSDSWVMSNIVEPALQSCGVHDDVRESATEEGILVEFRKVAERVVLYLEEQPVIVAHSEKTFDGSDIKRLFSNNLELDKTLKSALENLPRDKHRTISMHNLGPALDIVFAAAGLPPIGAVEEMDKVVGRVVRMMNVNDKKLVKEEEFKKILTEILGSLMLQLEGNRISVYSNSVVHEPHDSSSSFLP